MFPEILLPLLADLDPTSPEVIGGGVAAAVAIATAAYYALRKPKRRPEEERGEAGERAEEKLPPKERKAIEVARAGVAAPKEKPSGVAPKFGVPRLDEKAMQAEAEARRAEEEALRLAAARKKAEEEARRAEEVAKAAEARVIHLEEAKKKRAEEKEAAEGAEEAARKAEEAAQDEAKLAEEAKKKEEAAQEAQRLREAAEAARKAAEEARRTEEEARKKANAARELARKELERATSVSEGIARTRKTGFVAKLGDLFRGKKKVDPEIMEQVEEILFRADIGAQTVTKLLGAIEQELDREELKDPDAIFRALRQKSREILSLPGGPFDLSRAKGEPFVIMVIGVNGVGKTTTIGKLASRFVADDKTVILAAGDTFRAAASEQLEIWGERTACEVVKGKEGSDPSAVVYNAIKRAREVGADVVIADTAGRLHTKSNLMEELKKVKRVAGKALAGAPHEVLLVLDATMGQNAIVQAQQFTADLDVTGIALTKLDGTAKGGVILGICDVLKIPVRFIGIGEKVGDLRLFEPIEFVEALFSGENGK